MRPVWTQSCPGQSLSDNADAAAVHLNFQMVVAVDGDGFCLRQAGEAAWSGSRRPGG